MTKEYSIWVYSKSSKYRDKPEKNRCVFCSYLPAWIKENRKIIKKNGGLGEV